MKKHKSDRDALERGRIKSYAMHYHQPISDVKNFNKLLKSEGIKPVSRRELALMLGYAEEHKSNKRKLQKVL